MGVFGTSNFWPNKYEIDYHRYKPVDVNVTFNPQGKYKPESFRVSSDDEKYVYKILSCKCTNENKDYHTFYCTFESHGMIRDIFLRFHIRQCIWTIDI